MKVQLSCATLSRPNSYGGHCHAKKMWPLVLVNIQSSQCMDAYLVHSIEADMRHEFAVQPENVCSAASCARPPITDDLPIPHKKAPCCQSRTKLCQRIGMHSWHQICG